MIWALQARRSSRRAPVAAAEVGHAQAGGGGLDDRVLARGVGVSDPEVDLPSAAEDATLAGGERPLAGLVFTADHDQVSLHR